MHLKSTSFKPFERIDPKYAFGRHHPTDRFTFAGNTNPHLAWDGVPDGTRSLAVICVDHDVPSVGTDVNQPGRSVDVWLPRVPFYHWLLADLPATLREIPEGSHAAGVTVGGKPPGASPSGGVQGVNDYTSWFEGDAQMGGVYAGYDGCGPPWNDERLHGYRFQVFALDVPSLQLPAGFRGPQLVEAMRGHVLAQAELIGLYAINPEV